MDVTPQTTDTVIQLATGVVSMGFAVWYAWHTTTTTIPRLEDKHESNIRSIVDGHKATVDTLIHEFREETREQRSEYQRRADQSIQLATSGHSALHAVQEAVRELKQTVKAH